MSLDAANIERRIKEARLISRICMVLAILGCTFSVVLVMAMYQMGGRLSVVPQFFPILGGSDMMVYIDTLDQKADLPWQTDHRRLEWAFVQRFIEEKTFQIPDKAEMYRRWHPYGVLASMAYPRDDAFKPAYNDQDERLKNVDMAPIEHAENIRYISVNNHVWSVSFDSCRQTAAGPSCVPKQATVFIDKGSPRYGAYMNPSGFVVRKYVVQNRRN